MKPVLLVQEAAWALRPVWTCFVHSSISYLYLLSFLCHCCVKTTHLSQKCFVITEDIKVFIEHVEHRVYRFSSVSFPWTRRGNGHDEKPLLGQSLACTFYTACVHNVHEGL